MQKFSCLISCYVKDSPSQLRDALVSLQQQTLRATEVVFVEDGKLTSALYEIIEEFSNILPIKRICLDKNNGLGNALNIGLNECAYEIVVRMDTDDVCDPNRFEKQIKYLVTNPEIAIVGSWAKDINDKGEVIGERTFPVLHDDLYKIIWSCPFAHPTVAFRRSIILEIGSYRTDIKRRQDYELWMRAAAYGVKFANIPEFLLYYRFTDDYYKKNNITVAWSQAKMGLKGLKKLKEKRIYPYVAIFSPVARAVLPSFLERRIHRLLKFFDPRRQKAK